VDFLRDLPTLERLSLCVNGPEDWSGLYGLPNLHVLELRYVTRKVDFTRMRQLEEVSCNWKAGFRDFPKSYRRTLKLVTLYED